MARLEEKLPHNAEGDFFVDTSCIDCDTCRAIAPGVFSRASDFRQSFVKLQPRTEEERRCALMALVSCPTSAIGTIRKMDLTPGIESLPAPITDQVYYCGFTSESSFGASSYFIKRPEGNVLLDSPRASRALMRQLGKLGGVATMFLTHRDDVGDHDLYREEFQCERVIHAADLSAGTADVERIIQGEEEVPLASDLLAIPVPGHTAGSMALLFRNEFLFSGDHLWWSESRGRLHASRCVSWFSWEEQVRSLRKLEKYRFRWILPGHGRRFQASSDQAMRGELQRLLAAVDPKIRTAVLRAESR